MEQADARLHFDGPVLTEGAVSAIAILRVLGRVNEGDQLTPARICELIGCEEPDEHGLPPAEWLPELRKDICDPQDRTYLAAIELVMRELNGAIDRTKGGNRNIYSQALIILGANIGAQADMDEAGLHNHIRSSYQVEERERKLH